MIPSDLDEQLRRILMGSRMQGPVPETNPDEGMGLDEIRALGAGMTETAGEDMPPGTKVVFEPEVSAPVRKPLVPRAAEPMLPDKVVQVPMKSPDDIAAAYARAQDKQARRRMAMERGGRELVAGLTRTEVQPVTQRPTDAFARFAASQKEKRAGEAQAGQLDLGAAKLNYDTKEDARKAALHEKEREQDLAERKLDNEARDMNMHMMADIMGRKNDIAEGGLKVRRDEVETKKREKADREAAGAIPLFTGTLRTSPGLSDTERNQARTQAGLWNAADEATGQLEKALEAYVANPGAETAQNITALLGSASTALNTAYGQGAMAEAEARRMADTLGADIRSIGGMKALFDRAMGNPDAGKLLLSKIKTARAGNRAAALARLRASGQFTEGGGGANATPAAQDDGKVTVSNGKETLRIPMARLKDAERDGFKRVQ